MDQISPSRFLTVFREISEPFFRSFLDSFSQINLTETAEQDLVEIVDYIAGKNPAAALKVTIRTEKSILKLENFPLVGVLPRVVHQGEMIPFVD